MCGTSTFRNYHKTMEVIHERFFAYHEDLIAKEPGVAQLTSIFTD